MWYICIMEYYSVIKRFKHVEIHVNNIKRKCQSFSHVWLFWTLLTVACHAPLSVEVSRQEYWTRLPFPSLGDLPDPEMEPWSPTQKEILYCLSHHTWRNFKNSILSIRSQSQRTTYHMIPFIWNVHNREIYRASLVFCSWLGLRIWGKMGSDC